MNNGSGTISQRGILINSQPKRHGIIQPLIIRLLDKLKILKLSGVRRVCGNNQLRNSAIDGVTLN